ncbi:formyltransferase family protein [uncultured Brevundimonas sp.]|uniref:formyltransferase family protein n=1 Tax=uncultured Brevundimonas sp. TaxID=213418 RepID=UPI0030EB2E2D|tara:strand:+ start:407 stop:1240 length:834 start_codon:yes stop_codon:yes gene_type:complete
MSVVAVTGDHPRHVYVVQQLARAGLLSGWVVERREPHVPVPGDDVPVALHDLFNRHFQRREAAEHKAFGVLSPDGVAVDRLTVNLADLNGDRVRAFLIDKAPSHVLSYGCHKLDETILRSVSARFWNTHGGLSPWYRGVHTHFWPSYMLEPQMTGMTLHETTAAIDGGAIIHQSGVTLTRGDGLHDLACRAVGTYARELPAVMARALESDVVRVTQKTTGRIWIAAMWRAEHLVPIYRHYEDRIVDLCLDGEIRGRVPNLIRPLIESGPEQGTRPAT